LDIKQLHYFISIVEEGSFSQASNRVRIAQPALSLQVRKMEEELQTKLLIRGPHGVHPTEAGRLLLTRARTILTSMKHAEDDVRSLGRDPAGVVRIGLPGTISTILSVPLIARTRKDFPKIKLIIAEAMSGFVTEWLEESRVDLAVLYGEKQEVKFVSIPLLREELVMLIPPETAGDCTTAEEALADMPLILPSNTHGLRITLEQKMRQRNIAIDPTIEVDSYGNIKRLVASGYGCSILPYHSISKDIAEGSLACVRFGEPALWRSAHLVHNFARPLTRAAQVVFDQIIQSVDDLIESNSWSGAERL
jgi:LysR family nitrogen assimilation transcriptional regulator